MNFFSNYKVFRRFSVGDLVRCRVIDKVIDKRYIIRLYGVNIYVESNRDFQIGEEMELKVQRVFPRLSLVDINREKFNKIEYKSGKLVVY